MTKLSLKCDQKRLNHIGKSQLGHIVLCSNISQMMFENGVLVRKRQRCCEYKHQGRLLQIVNTNALHNIQQSTCKCKGYKNRRLASI
eukprot:scaffold6139_cov176-Cylindrotheca_fusiformis.AAC.1